MRENVAAVVVTYNRRVLLRECLERLRAQRRPLEKVVVVDNASTDGTAAMVRDEAPWADLHVLEHNLGGAGGFHTGLKIAYEGGADWVWLLDDDTFTQPDSLERLLDARRRLTGLPSPVILGSRVEWSDGRAHPMNMPILRRRDVAHLVACTEARVLPLRASTFVSFLVSRRAVERHGLPLKEYFLWADDIEYSARILREDWGYLIPDSVVEHRTKDPHTSVSYGGKRFYFAVRNTLFMLRGGAWDSTEKRPIVWTLIASSLAYLRANGFSLESAQTVLQGVRDGVRSLPRGTS
jgi:GT2 family glycosyltransferase